MEFTGAPELLQTQRKIVFFDGVCNICNGSVDYILRNSADHDLFIASLQGNFSERFLSAELRHEGMSTFLYYDGNELHKASEAVFRLSRELKGILPYIVRQFRILPRILTDRIYYLIARNRYLIAGKRPTCRLPTATEKSRFLE